MCLLFRSIGGLFQRAVKAATASCRHTSQELLTNTTQKRQSLILPHYPNVRAGPGDHACRILNSNHPCRLPTGVPFNEERITSRRDVSNDRPGSVRNSQKRSTDKTTTTNKPSQKYSIIHKRSQTTPDTSTQKLHNQPLDNAYSLRVGPYFLFGQFKLKPEGANGSTGAIFCQPNDVMPAQAGTQFFGNGWFPARAGMTTDQDRTLTQRADHERCTDS